MKIELQDNVYVGETTIYESEIASTESNCASIVHTIEDEAWSKVTVTAQHSLLSVTINSATVSTVATENDINYNVSILIQQWWLGGNFVGNIDQIILKSIGIQNLTDSSDESDDDADDESSSLCIFGLEMDWTKVTSISVLGLTIYSLVLVFVFRKYCSH